MTSHQTAITLSLGLFGLALLSLAFNGKSSSAQAPPPATAADNIVVSMSETSVEAVTGVKFSFSSTITNHGNETTPPLIGHINVASFDPEVHADPEDWTSSLAVNIEPIGPGASVSLPWTINSTLSGDFAIYVTVLPAAPDLAIEAPLASSPALHVKVQSRRTLNPGGVLPVVLAVPGSIALAFVGLRLREFRQRRPAG